MAAKDDGGVLSVAVADDWVVRTAGEVRAEAERRHPGEAPTCASGISPSGPVHLGNLRELMVPHLVADEVRKQGVPGRHILSWDDYDRLRRVPAGVPRVVRRAHRASADRGARPLRPATRTGPSTSRSRCASRWPGSPSWSPRSARPRCTPPAPTPGRSSPPCGAGPTSARCWPGTRPSGTPIPMTTTRATRAPGPTTRSSPTAPSAGATTPRSPASTTRPPRSPTPAPAGRRWARCRSPR